GSGGGGAAGGPDRGAGGLVRRDGGATTGTGPTVVVVEWARARWGVRARALEPDVADTGMTRLPITPALVASGSARAWAPAVGMLSETLPCRLAAVPSVHDGLWY